MSESNNQGSQDGKCTTPVIHDPDHIISGKCKAPEGGTQFIGPPEFVLEVKNPVNGRDFLPGS